MSEQTIRIEWADVKRRFIDSVRHGKPWRQAQQDALQRLHDTPYAVNEWEGGSGAQTLDWLDNGFYAPELQAAAQIVPTSERVRAGWSEEDGDIDVGRLYGGYDDFYLEVSPSETKPGLRLTADVFFAASTSPQVVKDYGAWIAGLIASLETAGYDLEVALCTPVSALYDGAKGRQNVQIAVKRPGELSDFTEWSALFSPTGLRHIVFTAFGVASESIGKRQTAHMAMSLTPQQATWGVTYDAAENHLHISVAQRGPRTFPAELLGGMLADCGLI
jgi:hypothetical protein